MYGHQALGVWYLGEDPDALPFPETCEKENCNNKVHEYAQINDHKNLCESCWHEWGLTNKDKLHAFINVHGDIIIKTIKNFPCEAYAALVALFDGAWKFEYYELYRCAEVQTYTETVKGKDLERWKIVKMLEWKEYQDEEDEDLYNSDGEYEPSFHGEYYG